MNEYIAYEGEKYTIEWYIDETGKSQPLEYAESLSDKDKAKISALFKLMGDIGKIQNTEKFRNEDDKIYAFKPKPHRFLCFFVSGRKIIVTNAFIKKQDKLPKQEKEKALKCKEDYEKRSKNNQYYK